MGLPTERREAMGAAAVRAAEACGYVNAGTVEFLFQDDEFFFLEMNTRLQVEHPVTELVTGLDLVEWQLRIAVGRAALLRPGRRRGDAAGPRDRGAAQRRGPRRRAGSSPPRARCARLELPAGPGVRVDAGYAAGDTVSQFYDNLICKIVTWGADREQARRRMLRALDETRVEGVATTIPADVAILSHPDFVAGAALDQVGRGAPRPRGSSPTAAAERRRRRGRPRAPRGHRRGRRSALRGRRLAARRAASASAVAAKPSRKVSHAGVSANGTGEVTVPMQGTVVKVLVAEGDAVEEGQTICILEAMKMENSVATERAGTVTRAARRRRGRRRRGRRRGGGRVTTPVERAVRGGRRGDRRAAVALSHDLHAHPETAFEEHHADRGADRGARASRASTCSATSCGLDTAFVATSGSGPVRIGLCAEYDALPDVGHACGHNVIAASTLGAGIGLARGGRRGRRDGRRARHPCRGGRRRQGPHARRRRVRRPRRRDDGAPLAVGPARPRRASRSTTSTSPSPATRRTPRPRRGPGVNAGDAMTIAQVAIGLLRQQLAPGDQVHGIVTSGGVRGEHHPRTRDGAVHVPQPRRRPARRAARARGRLLRGRRAGDGRDARARGGRAAATRT